MRVDRYVITFWLTFACGFAQACEIPQGILSNEQVSALCTMAEEYDIDIAQKDGRTIVLVGEWHHAPLSRLARAHALLDQFLFRGIEGAPYDDSWPAWFQYQLAELGGRLGFIQKNEMSLINETAIDGFTLLVDVDIEGTSYNGARMVPQKLSEFRSDLMPGVPVNIHLERDADLNRRLVDYMKECTPYYWRCNRQDLILDERNRAMVDAIVMSLEHFPQRPTMLVVTGAAHRTGMSRMLKCRYGFKILPIARGETRRDSVGLEKLDSGVSCDKQ